MTLSTHWWATSAKSSTDRVLGSPVHLAASQSVCINGDIYRCDVLTTTDKALYRFYVADKSVPPIYLRELS